jgi:hypothetical protein
MCLGLQEYESGSGWQYMSLFGMPTGLTVSRKGAMPTNELVFMVFQRLSAIASGSWSHGRGAPAHSPNKCGAKSLPSRSSGYQTGSTTLPSDMLENRSNCQGGGCSEWPRASHRVIQACEDLRLMSAKKVIEGSAARGGLVRIARLAKEASARWTLRVRARRILHFSDCVCGMPLPSPSRLPTRRHVGKAHDDVRFYLG